MSATSHCVSETSRKRPQGGTGVINHTIDSPETDPSADIDDLLRVVSYGSEVVMAVKESFDHEMLHLFAFLLNAVIWQGVAPQTKRLISSGQVN